MLAKAEEVIIHNKKWCYNNSLYISYPNCKWKSCALAVKCIGCSKLFCSGCHAIRLSDSLSYFRCNKCCSKKEFKDILLSIESALSKSTQIIIDRKLCHIITSYSTGLVVDCCNYLSCDKEINFKNKYEFDRFMDINYHTIYHYSMDNIQKLQNNMMYIYGKYHRVFCFECTTNGALMRCNYMLCNIKDVTFNNYMMCSTHLCCELCQCPAVADFQLTKCKKCCKHICFKCNYRNKPNNVCPPCYEKSKKRQLFILLECCLADELDVDIINMLTDFYIGGAVKCGNKYECGNDVCIGNRFNLERSIDVEGNQIYWYTAKKEARGKGKSLYIYHEPLIIFCSDCTRHNLQRCEHETYTKKRWVWQNGMRTHSDIKYYRCCNKEASFNICQIHPVCCICNSPQQYKREYRLCIMKNCHQYICDECASDTRVCIDCIGHNEESMNDNDNVYETRTRNINSSWSDIEYYDYYEYDVVVDCKSRGYIKEDIKCNNRYKGGNYGYKARKKKKRESHYKHENDKKSNVKNKRRFYKKFVLSLQY